jgi:WD40 repeat protein
VTTHGDGSIGVWDMVERRHAVGFNEHNDSVRAVAWSRDNNRFASAGEDRTVMIWNAQRASREMVLFGHSARITGLAFAPDSSFLVSVDFQGLVIIWDLAQRRERLRFSRKDQIKSLVVSPDGRLLVASDGVYDSASGRHTATLEYLNNIYGLAFSPDGALVAAVQPSSGPFIYNTAGQIVQRADLQAGKLISVGFSPDGRNLVTGEDGGLVQLWTAQPLSPIAVIGKHDARVKSVAFAPDGKHVVSAGDDKVIALWDVGQRKLISRIGLHNAPVYAVAFSPDGQHLVSGGHDHTVRLYTRHHSLWGWRWD